MPALAKVRHLWGGEPIPPTPTTQLLPDGPTVPPEEVVAVAEVEDADWSAQMASGMAALEATLAAQRDEMDPELWLIVDQSLSDIDDAIARIEAAMAQRPDDPQLLAAKARLRQQRVALLRTAVNL